MKKFGGKLFGAALGFSFGGPIGALIGAAVGHLFDTSLLKDPPRHQGTAERELAFITSLILLLTGTAKADGKITTSEVETIKNFFKNQMGYGPGEYFFIERIIDESVHKDVEIVEVCREINGRTTYEERLFLLHLNYQVAVSDGFLNPREEDYIQRLKDQLGINDYDFNIIKNSFAYYKSKEASEGYEGAKAKEIVNPYKVLGLSNNCTNEEVQKAYRDLVSKYHPDKVLHLGEEFINLANIKFTQIQGSYEIIKRERGIQ